MLNCFLDSLVIFLLIVFEVWLQCSQRYLQNRIQNARVNLPE